MTFRLLSLLILFINLQACSSNYHPFNYPNGKTNWQYIANFSSSVLIITLLIVAIFLFFTNRRAIRANRELTDIKASLEDRVARRTASLEATTTQLKSREAYISSIVNSMPIMLIGVNDKMEVLQWNHVAESITGRPADTVLGKTLWEAYPAITLTQEQVTQVLTNKETLTIKHSQRGQYYFDITLYALTENNETGIIILVNDVTKQIKAENKVAERDKTSAMGELTSGMAYDINLPLQSILSRLKVAEETLRAAESNSITDTLLQTLKPAHRSGQQAAAIVQNLLELANSHREKKQPADMTQVMNNAINLAQQLFSDPEGLAFEKITLNRHYSDNLPKIPCITSELEQVLVRILRSAFHALNTLHKHHAFTPVINIEIKEFYNTLWMSIQHNGECISPEEQRDIFIPFFSVTANPAACPVERRLSYSYFIITDHHQGQMAVTSDEQHGTSFHIQLPQE